MKLILSTLFLFSLNAAKAEECSNSPAFLNLKTITYSTSKISGDYIITYVFPDLTKLKSTSCMFNEYTKQYEVQFDREELKVSPIHVEIKRNDKVTQTDIVTFLRFEKSDAKPYSVTFGSLEFLREEGLYRILCDEKVEGQCRHVNDDVRDLKVFINSPETSRLKPDLDK